MCVCARVLLTQASKAAFGDSAGVPQVTRVPIDLGDVTTLEASLEAAAVAVRVCDMCDPCSRQQRLPHPQPPAFTCAC